MRDVTEVTFDAAAVVTFDAAVATFDSATVTPCLRSSSTVYYSK